MAGIKKSIHRIPEKTCPICGEKCNRRRAAQYCAHCDATLWSYRVRRNGSQHTIWVTSEPRIKNLVLCSIEHIREIPNMSEYEPTNWEQELGSAHTLLDRCEGNQELAMNVVGAFYDRDTRHECGIYGNFPRSVSAIISRWKSDELAWLMALTKNRLGYHRQDMEQITSKQMEML